MEANFEGGSHNLLHSMDIDHLDASGNDGPHHEERQVKNLMRMLQE